jgi:hypothetical protein
MQTGIKIVNHNIWKTKKWKYSYTLKGNTEEQNKGYVVFKRDIHVSAGKYRVVEIGRGVSTAGFWTDI